VVGTPGEGDPDVGGEPLLRSPDTGISLLEEFLSPALNLLSMVSLRLRFEVLMGRVFVVNLSLEELTHELLPKDCMIL